MYVLTTTAFHLYCVARRNSLFPEAREVSESKSYRPICFLSTLGKLIEKLLVYGRTLFLETNNIWHLRQFGFREGRYCDKALHAILTSCVASIAAGNYTSHSLHIQKDNAEWRDILTRLNRKINCPDNLAEFTISYFSLRSLLIKWSAGTSSHRLEKSS